MKQFKKTRLFVIGIFLIFQANYGFSKNLDNEKISLELNDATLVTVFEQMTNLTQFKFTYGDYIANNSNKYTVSFQNKEVTIILDDLSKKVGFDYKIEENNIIIGKREQQKEKTIQQKISGKVVDKTGEPLPGATVSIKGTSIGVSTDFDGNFQLELTNEAKTLVVSFVGFETKEINIGSETVFNITLLEDAQVLDEVVIIGYGEQSRAKVVGAVGELKNEELTKVASASIEQQIAGKMSGVVVNQFNGQPGAASQIVIRGTGTLTAGANPLIVVDGYPLTEGSSLNSINSNDISDISILKDAASAAIYGSRAANGVILVTTKKGKSDQKTSISLHTYMGIQEQSSGVELVDAYKHAQFLTEARNWGYVSKDPLNRSESDPNSVRVTKKINGRNIDGRELYLDYLQPYLDGEQGLINTNWMNEAFRAAPMYNYDLSISGGNKKTRYYTSLGYFHQEGIVIGSGLKRYSATLNLDSKISDKVKFGINIKPTFTVQDALNQSSRSSGALALIPLNFPSYSPYKFDGSLNISDQLINEQREIEGVRINGTPVENLVATSRKVIDQKDRFRTFGNIYLDAEIFKNLKYKFSMGGDYDAYVRNYYYPSDVGSYRTPAPRSDADATERKLNRYNYLVENTLNYQLKSNKHSLNVLVGHTFQKEKISSTTVKATGFADNNIQNIAGGSSFTVDNTLDIWTLESYLSRVQYDYNSKYLFSAAIRADGSSRFGSNNRWGYFPSVSAGWVFNREEFFPLKDIITFGKISGSWGQTGNNQIGNYSSQALVTDSNYVFDGGLAPGYITTTAPNPDLGWEVASSLNVGLDLGLFHKVNLSAAYYKTNTRDLLLDVPVPQQTGYTTVLANIGEMENKGLELQLSGQDFSLGNVKVGFNANLTSYNNKVLALGPGQKEIATGTDQNFVTKVGHSIAEIYGYEVDGVFKTQEEIDNTPHLPGTLTGDYKVKDMNGDGVINVDDKVSKGSYMPDFTYGFGANLQYEGFTFSFGFNGVKGRTLMDGDMSSLTESGEGFAVPTTYYFENRYHPENNPNGFLGQPNFGNFSNSRKLLRSSVVVERNNGDYIRLRDVRLAYDFSESLLNKLKLSKLQVYVSGNNLFTSTDYRGWNPDGTSGNILTSGFNNGGNYPVAKTYLVGVRVTY
ncbi:TonB-linked SusC/RagA family outer membrane protein [Tenacibaculum lutimaris]|uniref:TonB-linked SusC/RagA family outer membrane protein n=1 Tax=Tenacibaculum lutimaris TaxID=285258 RepID=A0A420E3R1_9FLAO|nr:SusC/RagA family TonB-linked outer membrane protein [Tenacibaculum lutimaris]RKF04738.1 TonB-linked SusC/RagA family outer membrane protein [Tenacibaculum lutimaris]